MNLRKREKARKGSGFDGSSMKSIGRIREDWCDNDNVFTESSLEDLKLHLENEDEDPYDLASAMRLVADARLMGFVPLMAKHLTHKSSVVRETLIQSLVGRLKLPEYAEVGLKMAQQDPYEHVRDAALFNIGYVLRFVTEETLRKKIAAYLLQILCDENLHYLTRRSAYHSIISALEFPLLTKFYNIRTSEDIDWDLVDQFRKRYESSNEPAKKSKGEKRKGKKRIRV